jgi:VanZ family protein
MHTSRLHRILFWLLVILWTWLLLKPNPVPEFVAKSFIDDVKYVMGKTLHFAAFAAMAWYGCFRRERRQWKWVWLGCGLHAVASELGQHFGDLWFQTHRTGSVCDVMIDCAGILAGAWVRCRRGNRF